MGILTLILTPMPVLELAPRSKQKRQFRECKQGNFILVTFFACLYSKLTSLLGLKKVSISRAKLHAIIRV